MLGSRSGMSGSRSGMPGSRSGKQIYGFGSGVTGAEKGLYGFGYRSRKRPLWLRLTTEAKNQPFWPHPNMPRF